MALTKYGKDLLPYLDDPRVLAFLDTIADAEGVQYGYKTLFGNTELESLDAHPKIVKKFRTKSGKDDQTTAAGRYQFLGDTWDDLTRRLGLDSFGELNQDLGAVELIRRAGALDDIVEGRFEQAVSKLGGTWASLPSSPYDQPTRSEGFVNQRLADHLLAHGETATFDALSRAERGLPEVSEMPKLPSVLATPEDDAAKGLTAVMNDEGEAQTAEALTDAAPATFSEEWDTAAAQGIPEVDGWGTGMDQLVQALAARSGGSSASLAVEDDGGSGMGWDMPVNLNNQGPPSGLGDTDWEDELVGSALQDDAETARRNAENTFLGIDAPDGGVLPKALERAINRVIGTL